jgi:hypothetical protein
MTDEPDAPSLERQFLGIVEVDSGTLLVGDPVYCLPSVEHGKAGIDYSAIYGLSATAATPLAGMPVLLLGQFGGDGTFPVFGEFEDGELMRVTIEFIDPLEE